MAIHTEQYLIKICYTEIYDKICVKIILSLETTYVLRKKYESQKNGKPLCFLRPTHIAIIKND